MTLYKVITKTSRERIRTQEHGYLWELVPTTIARDGSSVLLRSVSTKYERWWAKDQVSPVQERVQYQG